MLQRNQEILRLVFGEERAFDFSPYYLKLGTFLFIICLQTDMQAIYQPTGTFLIYQQEIEKLGEKLL